MRRTLNFSRVVMTVCLCIAGKLLSAGNLSDRNNKVYGKEIKPDSRVGQDVSRKR